MAKKLQMRSLYAILGLALFILISGCSNQVKANNSTKVPITENQNIEITATNYELIKKSEKTKAYQSVSNETTYLFDILNKGNVVGHLKTTARKLKNGDVFVFSKLENLQKEPLNINVAVTLDGVTRYDLNDWNKRYVEHKHNGTTGVDPVTPPIGLLEAFSQENLKYSLVLSKNILSKPLVKKYENGKESRVREFIAEEKSFYTSVQSDQVEISLPLQTKGNDLSENWFLFSKEKLFQDEKLLNNWIDFHLDSYNRANSWLTAEGSFKKLPWSIEPYTKLGYGRNLGLMQDKTALDNYEVYHERYFYNLVLNSVTDLLKFREEAGTDLWETEYTSAWLKKAYNTTAPYIDTRHNENIALFLTRTGRILNIPELEQFLFNYGDYLVNQVQKDNTIHVSEYYLIADYFSPYAKMNKTHSSLNHILGGMNILLECYEQNGDRKYLEAATSIRFALETIGDKWIRDSGDLWYQINPDLTFSGNDYELLTLIDLLTAQNKWEGVGLKRSPVLDKFIHSKAGYLVKEKKPIYPYVIDMLSNQGFESVLTKEYLDKRGQKQEGIMTIIGY